MRLPAVDLGADQLELIANAEWPDLVPRGTQSGYNIVLGFPFIDLLLAVSFGRIRGYQIRVHEHHDAKPFHSAIHLRRDGPKSACIVLAVKSTANSIISTRSGPTARRLSSRHRATMSSSTASIVSWYSPVHFATSRLIFARLRLINTEADRDPWCLGTAHYNRIISRMYGDCESKSLRTT